MRLLMLVPRAALWICRPPCNAIAARSRPTSKGMSALNDTNAYSCKCAPPKIRCIGLVRALIEGYYMTHCPRRCSKGSLGTQTIRHTLGRRWAHICSTADSASRPVPPRSAKRCSHRSPMGDRGRGHSWVVVVRVIVSSGGSDGSGRVCVLVCVVHGVGTEQDGALSTPSYRPLMRSTWASIVIH